MSKVHPSPRNNPDLLPTKYKVLNLVGRGTFAKVLRCLDRETNTIVAVKIPLFTFCGTEMLILNKLMKNTLDKENIIKYYGSFSAIHGEAHVFEYLKLSLEDYIMESNRPMNFSDIRSIITQLATALNALKNIGIIHGDIKFDNIMLKDEKHPLRVKLIDFGLAINTSSSKPGTILQSVCLRAPEILLGLPFSEAIDMWSLGCLLYTMLFETYLFPDDQYGTMLSIIKLLGQPPDELLNKGKRTGEYFIKRRPNTWRIKTLQEYNRLMTAKDPCVYDFESLVYLKQMFKHCDADAGEFAQCIELLKAMLTMDQNKRITPAEVLQHPFITQNKMTPTSSHSDRQSPPPNILPSGVILVRSATPENMLQLEEEESSVRNKMTPTSSHSDRQSPPPNILPSGVILVRSATPENMLQLEEEESSVRNKMTPTSSHSDRQSPPPNILPSGVILVRSATPENMLQLEEEESSVRNKMTPTSSHSDRQSPPPNILPSGVILVRSATPENMLQLEEEESSVSVYPEHRETPSPPVDNVKKGTKKNCFQRFKTWFKKNFFCNRVGVM